ncbi:IclR family transcriptional regulator [Streptomyces xinghaiensis]|uniref:IclR family transcriptional regulator n=1 Tax=Streptomyces xinghaiensis TaxID=1038928 RepID=UPI003434BF84
MGNAAADGAEQTRREPPAAEPYPQGRGSRTGPLSHSPGSQHARTGQPGRVRRASRSGSGPVLGRALQILGAFSTDHPELSLSELSRKSGLPVSTVHRMLGELTAWGALERGADGRYRIGLRLWQVGSLAPRSQGLREHAMPFLQDLSQITRENVQLAVREGAELVFVERIAGSGAVPVLTRVGGRFAMTATGVGLVLLAHAPVDVQEKVLTGPLQHFTPRTVTDPQVLRRMLADIRINGYAVSERQVTMDSLSVAAPVRDGDNAVIAAVSLVVHHGSASPRALAQLVCTSARAISRAMAAPRA